MRFIISHKGLEQAVDVDSTDVVVGHANAVPEVGLDLGKDPAVSDRHARLWIREGHWWLQDLGSVAGSWVNGIRLEYKRQLHPTDVLRFGDTKVTLDFSAQAVPDPGPMSEGIKISDSVDARIHTAVPLTQVGAEAQGRLGLLYDLPLQFAAETNIHDLYELIIARVVELIPGAKRGALLTLEPASGKLKLRSGLPADNPPVSRALVQRAALSTNGFIWSQGDNLEPTQSMQSQSMASGMCAPLLWKGDTIGVISVDNPISNVAFCAEDLRFLLAVAHYAAATVANSLLQKDLEEHAKSLEQSAKTMEHLLTNFSPQIREQLLEKSREGKLQPGGEKSNVTVLFSDIRGFTNTTADMDAAVVVDMLNEYFSALVDAIFKYDGTIDKFIGDAILAVFGSPWPDEDQHAKAVRAALEMQTAMAEVNERRRERGDVTCELGIGLHYGEVLHGFIGAEERLEFTVIGDTVNRTSRYCDGARGGEVLVSPALYNYVAEEFTAEATSIPTKHEGHFEAFRIKSL